MLHSQHIPSDTYSSQGNYKISILLIEDSEDDHKIISYYLRKIKQQTYEIRHASTLHSGLEILQQGGIDVVMLDLQLPDSLGLQTFDILHSRFPELPVIIMTGASHEEHLAMQALERGAQDYLEKENLDSPVLKKAIQYSIKRKEMVRGLEKAQRLGKLGFWELNPISMEWKGAAYLEEMMGRGLGKPIRSLAEFLELVHPEDREQVKASFQEAALHHKDFDLIHRIVPSQQGEEEKYFSLKGKSVLNAEGKIKFIEGTAQDISERRKLDEVLQQKELAEKEAKLRQDFLAKTSHEIRTPLNPILMLTEMLLEGKLGSEQEKQIATIRHAAKTLLALVNDILDISKIEAGKIDFDREIFSIGDVLDPIYDLMKVHADRKRLKLQMYINEKGQDMPAFIIGDSVRLSQILINLITNALKFTHEGKVDVMVDLLQRGEREVWLEFKVIDTGVGIPHNQLEAIFESFKQVPSTQQHQLEGTGLGLTIVRQLVKLQGGNIFVESKEDEGSSFSFELPFELPPELPASEDPFSDEMEAHTGGSHKQTRDLYGLNILMVEDDPLNQLVTTELLTRWNAQVEIANNGEEGIQKLMEGDYDLILMDLQMPVKDGLTATREIRNTLESPYRDIPIIALTANAISGSDDECFKVGMNDYVSKPIETDNFYRKLVGYINEPHSSNKKSGAASNNLPEDSVNNETENEIFPMSDTRYTDLSSLTSMYGGDMMLVKKTVKKIVDKIPEYLEDMNSFRRDDNLLKVAEMIHKMKANVVGYMGISEFSETGLDSMIAGIKSKDKTVEEIDQFLEKFNSVVKTGVQELQSDLDGMA